MSPERTAFAPATVGNVIVGFDVFGLALEAPGDRVTARAVPGGKVSVVGISGDGGRLPRDAGRNSAAIAAKALLDATGRTDGLELSIEKGLPLSGGMGGSAASAVAGAVAADAALGTRAASDLLLRCALEGESAASGGAHLDNIAPALLGGIVLVRPGAAHPAIPLPVPEGLHVALLHPAVELRTREARAVLGDTVPLRDAVAQWGDTAAFVHALHTGDWELLRESLVDRIAEPKRAGRIPGFAAVRNAALAAGAVACGISGAGPSLVALCRGAEAARAAGSAMERALREAGGPGATLHLSPVAREGARLLPDTGRGSDAPAGSPAPGGAA